MRQSFLNERKKGKALKQRRFLAFFYVALGILFTGLVALLFVFQNRLNYIWMLCLFCPLLCFLLLVFFYSLFFLSRPLSSLLKIYASLERRKPAVASLIYLGTKEGKETERNLTCQVLRFENGERREMFFYALEEEEIALKAGQRYEIKEISSFLVEANEL